MSEALLRSGKLEAYKALGDDGQPVYRSAQQLRQAVRIKAGEEAANYLAIPQLNEAGDHIDWYAPVDGDVVPWTTATQAERDEAIVEMDRLNQSLIEIADLMVQSESPEQQVFGRLLQKAVHFPDKTHVYLVDGKPVIAFWGFAEASGIVPDDPLACLRLLAPVEKVLSPEPVVPLVVAEPVQPRRFRWWWWLLILLLLLALLWLWRGCSPQVSLTDLDLDSGAQELPEVDEVEELPAIGDRDFYYDANDYDTRGIRDGGLADGDGVVDETASEVTDEIVDEAVNEALDDVADESLDDMAEEEIMPEPPQEESDTLTDSLPPELDSDMPVPQPGERLSSEQLQSGNADFLNGSWKAGAGIQDARTGRPLQLDYDFNDGEGTVSVKDSSGQDCVGSVSAASGADGLTISSRSKVKCQDGTTYNLPDVACKPGAQSAADCHGTYDDKESFPMSIKRSQ